jgi:aminoglycoside phosphotransferase (APT) family kinase protein
MIFSVPHFCILCERYLAALISTHAGTRDPDGLSARLASIAAAARPGCTVRSLVPLDGGASSLTFRAELVSINCVEDIVVKMAPPGLKPVRNRDVLRQARILRLLSAGESVPVPEVLFEDSGSPPGVPPLFAMSYVAGDSVEPLFHEDAASGGNGPSPRDITFRAHRAAQLLVGLQTAEVATGIEVGEATSLRHEVGRWGAALETIDESVGDWGFVRDALMSNAPPELGPVLSHGDYRLGNMLSQAGTITAVIDWELWTLADPRLDLGWYRLNADPSTYRSHGRLSGSMPDPDALLATYLSSGGYSSADIGWFDALARFKAVATWSLILKRSKRTGDKTFLNVGPILPELLLAAKRLLG